MMLINSRNVPKSISKFSYKFLEILKKPQKYEISVQFM